MAKKKGEYWTTETSKTIGEVDVNNGDLLKMKQTRVCHSQREFIKVYFDCISEITGGLEDGCYSILFAIWKYSYFPLGSSMEGNKFNNDKGFKEECKTLGINKTDKAINTAVYRLAKRGVIKPIAKGVYTLNPKYFAKGTITEDTEMSVEVKYKPQQLPPNPNAE
jgi:hypothetical protein